RARLPRSGLLHARVPALERTHALPGTRRAQGGASLLKRAAAIVGVVIAAAAPAVGAPRPQYDVDYRVEFVPREGVAKVAIAIEPHDGRVSRVQLHMNASRYSEVAGDG